MAFTGIQGTIDFYTQQEADLTNQITDILMSETLASRETTEIADQSVNQRTMVKNEYTGPDGQITNVQGYDDAMAEIQDNYQLQLAKITSWESELQTKQQQLETQLKAVTSYKESFMGVLKQNVQKSFKYGDGSGSSSS